MGLAGEGVGRETEGAGGSAALGIGAVDAGQGVSGGVDGDATGAEFFVPQLPQKTTPSPSNDPQLLQYLVMGNHPVFLFIADMTDSRTSS